MTPIHCSNCRTKLGEIVDGIVMISITARGGQVRRIIARQCIIVCERCGETWTADEDRTPTVLRVAS